jgi:hypothetical protein
MISLTYGVLPRYEDFEAAFEEDLGSDTYSYELKGTDADVAEEVGIPEEGEFRPRQLYAVLVKLTDAFQDGYDEAGDVASGILTTLGIEWI